MAERQRRTSSIQRPERFSRVESAGPQIIHPRDLQLSNLAHLVAQHRDTRIAEDLHEARGYLRMGPARPVVVISQDAEGGKAPARRVGVDALHVRVQRPLVAGEVAGVDDDVRSQIPDRGERLEDVTVIDLRADVKSAQLHKRAPVEVG